MRSNIIIHNIYYIVLFAIFNIKILNYFFNYGSKSKSIINN